jgi:hypothetical protein
MLLPDLSVGGVVKSHVYILGCFETRVTLLSQQIRALNLIYSLFNERILKKGSRVAVIGGGVSGITAAAGAAFLECQVTLLEKNHYLLHLLRGNTTRWIHPHIYDWPEEGAENPNAGLPILNWRAGLAGDVTRQILNQWESFQYKDRIKVITGVDITEIGFKMPVEISWNSIGFKYDAFDAVILAVGFGTETKKFNLPSTTYWQNDVLGQINNKTPSKKFLISGCGDGGLVDLLRIRIADFRHEHIIDDFVSKIDNSTIKLLKEKLLEIENEAWRQSNPNWIYQQYQSLNIPPELDVYIKDRLRHDTEAVLNGHSSTPLILQSCILNRLLVSRLLAYDTKYIPSRLSTVEKVNSENLSFVAEFENGNQEYFDEIIIRHGTKPALSAFPYIAEKCKALPERNQLDQTRFPIWPQGIFGETASLTLQESDSSKWKELSLKLVLAQRDAILQRPLLGHMPDRQVTEFLFPEVFVDPPIKSRYNPSQHLKYISSLPQLLNDKKRLFLLGGPGYGKTTVLISCYLHFVEKYLKGTSSVLPLFIDLPTLDLSKITNLSDVILELAHFINLPISNKELAVFNHKECVFFLDSCDESGRFEPALFAKRFKESSIRRFPHIAASRLDFFEKYLNEVEFTSNYGDIFEIQEWEPDVQVKKFISGYLIKVGRVDELVDLMKILCAPNGSIIELFRTPIALTIMLFIWLYAPKKVTPRDLFELYSFYLQEWCAHEKQLLEGPIEQCIEAWEDTAWLLATNQLDLPLEISELTEKLKVDGHLLPSVTNWRSFKSLLRLFQKWNNGIPQQTLAGFLHESIGEFLAARRVVNAFVNKSDDNLRPWLSYVLPYEVNVFLREAFMNRFRKSVEIIVNKLQRIYLSEVIKGKDSNITIRNQAIYYLGRIGGENGSIFLVNLYNDIINNRRDEHPMVTGTIATGLMLIDTPEASQAIEHYLLQLKDNSPEDIRNRSFHLVYYGDQINEGPDKYLFDRVSGDDDWVKTRRALCKRFVFTSHREVLLRALDLITFFRFCQTRSYKTPTEQELAALLACKPIPSTRDGFRETFIIKTWHKIMSFWEIT